MMFLVPSYDVPPCETCFLIYCSCVYLGLTFRCFLFCFMFFGIPSAFLKRILTTLVCYLAVYISAYLPWEPEYFV